MKKIFTLFLALAASVGTMFAEKVQIGYLYYNLDATNKTAEVTYQSVTQGSNYPDLTTVHISSSVTYNDIDYSVIGIAENAFNGCTELISITLPNSLTNISDSAFYGCRGLTSVVIPNNVTNIGYGAFYNIPNIAYNGTATGSPWGAKSVNGYVEGWLVYSDNTKTTLLGCSSAATGEITIPNSVTSIGRSAFYGCTHLTNVTIPNSVTNIGTDAFLDCAGLNSVSISNSITCIEYGVFCGCSGLTSITIPNSVTRIENAAFQGCSALTSITCEATIPPSASDYAFWGVNTSIPVYVPEANLTTYKITKVWKEFTNIQAIGNSDEPMYPIFVHLVDSVTGQYIGTAEITMDRDTALFGTWTKWGEQYLVDVNRVARNQWVFMHGYTPEYRPVWWSNSEGNRIVDDTLRFTATDTTDVWLVVSPIDYTIHVSSESGEKGFIRCNYAPFNHADTMFYARYWDSLRVEAVPNEGYEFKQWSDGSTSNPHYLTVKENVTLVAMFESSKCQSYFWYTPDTVCSNEEVYYWRGRKVYYTGKIDTVRYSENSICYYRHGDYQIYRDSMVTIDGCDSIYELRIFWAPSSKYVGCYTVDSGSYYAGQIITESGIYRDSMMTIYGCDSIHEWHLTVRSVTYITVDTAICEGEYLRLGGMTWTQAGQHVFKSVDEDTLFTLNLTVYPRSYTTNSFEFNADEPVIFNGHIYDQLGTYYDTLVNAKGCDSIIITIIQPKYYHISLSSNNARYGWAYGDTLISWPDTTSTIKAWANTGYTFSRWSDGNMMNPRIVIVKSDTAFTAIFKPIKYNITVEANDPMLGSVRGGGSFLPNELITIMATPYNDCEFVQWSDGSKLNPRSVRVTCDSTFTAVFDQAIPPQPVVYSDTLFFSAADTTLLAIRIYDPSAIQEYDRFVIATTNNKQIMGRQGNFFRDTIAYEENTDIDNVAIVTAIPHDSLFRLQTTEGFLTPGNMGRNALYSDSVGADWLFAQYENVIVAQTVYYEQRMILYNEHSPHFSSYRQVTGLDRHQTSIYKLEAPRIIPSEPIEIKDDTTAWQEEQEVVDSIPTEIVPQDTTVVITTPYVEYVSSFTIIIWADEAHTQVLCILTFDSNGQLLTVTTPNKVRRMAMNSDICFEIGDLLPSTQYYYTLMACDDDGSVLQTVNDDFTTTEKVTDDIDQITDDQSSVIKQLRDGQILILRGDKTYTITGQEVK